MLLRKLETEQVNVSRPRNVETTALGAARVAAVGAGVKSSLEVIPSLALSSTVFKPEMAESAREAKCASWDRAVTASLAFGTQA